MDVDGAAYRLGRNRCIGVERQLKECPRYQNLVKRPYKNCKNKVVVNCDNDGMQFVIMVETQSTFNIMYFLKILIYDIAPSTRKCLNGALHDNKTDNILYICVSGVWRPMCSYFWGHTQATVACRQLNPERDIFSEQ